MCNNNILFIYVSGESPQKKRNNARFDVSLTKRSLVPLELEKKDDWLQLRVTDNSKKKKEKSAER